MGVTDNLMGVVPSVRQITPKNGKNLKVKFIDEAKQGVYTIHQIVLDSGLGWIFENNTPQNYEIGGHCFS